MRLHRLAQRVHGRFHRANLLAPLVLLVAFLAASCLDHPGGPGAFQGQFALAPSFESSVASIVTIDHFRVLLRRTSDGSVALDSVMAITPGADSVGLSLQVPMFSSSETFLLTLSLITPAGDTAFRAGPSEVLPSITGGAPPAVQLTVVYVGVGAAAKAVRIVPDSSRVFFGDTVALVAEALDSTGTVIPGTPVGWRSLDTVRARVPDPAQGKVVGGGERGTARIVAELLTGPTDTAGVLVQPLPVRVSIDSGDGQTAPAGAPLPNPIVVRVKAADSLGVAGTVVRFTIPPGAGTLTADSGVTNASGRVGVGWTLGTTPGVYSLTAKVSGVQDSVAVATVTVAPAATKLVFTVQPSTAVAGAILQPAVAVTALDASGNPDVNFTGTVTLALGANPGSGTLFGTLTRATTQGVATFDDLMINTAGSGYTLTAASGGLTPATSAAFDVTTPAPASVVWVTGTDGNWSNPAKWMANPGGTPLNRVPAPGDTVFINQPGTYTVTLDVDAHVASLFVGSGVSGTQTLAISGHTLIHDSLAEFIAGGTGMGVLALSSGAVASADTLAIVGGAFSWTGGTLTGGGALLAYGTMNLGGGAKTLDNYKLVNLSSATWSAGNLTASSGGTFRNEVGATLSVTGNVTFATGGGSPPPTFQNRGTLDVQGATLSVATAFTHDQFAVLQGTGTLDIAAAPSVVFDGDVNPGTSPGILAIAGPFPQGQTSTLNVEINGTSPGTEYDQLNVSGRATLRGGLNLTTAFAPTVGQSFRVFTFASDSGQFARVTGTDLYPMIGTGLALDTAWASTALDVVADGQIAFSGDSLGDPAGSGLFRTNASTTFRENVNAEGNGYDSYPRWSPDRKRLTYTPNDTVRIVGAAPASASVPLVTDMLARRARYSPDGVHLAFECGSPTSGITDVCTIADVTAPTPGMGDRTGKAVVTDSINAQLDGPPAFAWNPTDPKQLAVVRDTSIGGSLTSRIYLVNYDGTSKTLVSTLPPARRVVETMDWSPDGTMLTFGAVNDSTGDQQIWTLTLAGGVLKTVSDLGKGADSQPAFSPDGTEILFQRNRGGCTNAIGYVITSASTGVERVELPTTVYCEGATDAAHDWSPDGRQIVLVDGSLSDPNKVYVVPRDVTAANYLSVRRLVGRPGGTLNVSDKHPSWRP